MQKNIFYVGSLLVLALLSISYINHIPSDVAITDVSTVSTKQKSSTPTVSIRSIASPSQTASASLQGSLVINWDSKAYPQDATVNINLLEKLSDDPASYRFVKSIMENAPNTGQYIWLDSSSEKKPNMYVEVTCGNGIPSNQSCMSNGKPLPLE